MRHYDYTARALRVERVFRVLGWLGWLVFILVLATIGWGLAWLLWVVS